MNWVDVGTSYEYSLFSNKNKSELQIIYVFAPPMNLFFSILWFSWFNIHTINISTPNLFKCVHVGVLSKAMAQQICNVNMTQYE